MKNVSQVTVRQGSQVTTSKRANALSDLLPTSFLVIATRGRDAIEWQYSIPECEIKIFKSLRQDGKVTTAQRADDVEFHLLAKLAA